jgi:hypothetical protein
MELSGMQLHQFLPKLFQDKQGSTYRKTIRVLVFMTLLVNAVTW